MENTYKILLVDDEPDILEFLGYNLTKAGYQIFQAKTGKEAIQKAREVLPHLILLDVMMPEIDGIQTCEELRSFPELQQCIIAFLTARAEDYSQIAGFEAGGDDYITKPVKPKVLISRIKALLKRLEPAQSLQDNGKQEAEETEKELIIDKERYLVIHGNNELILPRKEFELLALLISKPDRVFTREDIFSAVWGNDVIVGDRTIDVHIRKLREKIGDNYIKTIKGVGYKYSV
ncbi:MAG TPA: response regulator transcription factor [Bacteroidales bacterium]|nr:response regulator transcription factor [Bacteroidales bacterium]